jgi:hypothetical protein
MENDYIFGSTRRNPQQLYIVQAKNHTSFSSLHDMQQFRQQHSCGHDMAYNHIAK